MGKLHRTLDTTDLHVPGYVQAEDPGTVGAGILWIDTSAGPGGWVTRVRNDANDDWESVGGGGGASMEVRSDYDHPYNYIGVAPVGSAEDANVWRITRIDVGPPVEVFVLSGVAWDDRSTLDFDP
jgi:hypothetical protein